MLDLVLQLDAEALDYDKDLVRGRWNLLVA